MPLNNRACKLLLSALLLSLVSACEFQDPPPYYPLGNKLQWHYKTTMVYTRRSVDSKLIIEDLGSDRINGRKVFIKRNHTGNSTYFSLSDDSILRNSEQPDFTDIDPETDTHFVLPLPMSLDTEWTLKSRPYVLEKAIEYEVALQTSTPGIKLSKPLEMNYRLASLKETVDVPAGRFYNCAKVEGTGSCTMSALGGNFSGSIIVNVEHAEWFCPGVGLTKSVRSEVDPSSLIEPVTYRQELEKLVEPSFF